MAEEPMEVSATAESVNQSAAVASENTGETEASAEPTTKNENKETPTKTDGEPGKRVYTEEEKLKRKAFFKKMREKKRLARERYQRQNVKRSLINPRSKSLPLRNKPEVVISFDMTLEEDKMLEFYKVKLSTLKSTNEQLHKRLAYLVKENMRLLQLGPPIRKA